MLQACTQYSVELLKDNRSQHVDELAGHLGLQRVSGRCKWECRCGDGGGYHVPQVGWIFTDLESEGNGKVAHKRNMVSLFCEHCNHCFGIHCIFSFPSPSPPFLYSIHTG